MRRPILSQVRSFTGVIIGTYVTLHLLNHALGLISLDAQETARPYFMAFWHSPPGQLLLYGSLILHAGCALSVLWRRRTYALPIWEGTQIILGLTIPYLLLVHIVNTRGTRILTGIDINYPYEIANLWIDPWLRAKQILLVLLVWGHFVVGLHFWLRLQAWYRRSFSLMLLAYVLIPTGALLGFAESGMKTTAKARSDPAWLKQVKTSGVPVDPHRASLRALLKDWVGPSWLGLVGVIFGTAQLRHWQQRHHRFKVRFPEGFSVSAPIGTSVLEVSRRAHRAHVSVCGGRGRCTTCRIRVEESTEPLPSPNELEDAALARIGAPEDVRLACQLRPVADLLVRPLLHPTFARPTHRSSPRGREFGEERRVTILFVDLRGSTRLAEARLPYDVVFLLNHYLAEMTEAVDHSSGHYSNFTGDGLMALFGLENRSDYGANGALRCACEMVEKVERLNEDLAAELPEPLAIGIGIHTGEAIVGRMGPPRTPLLSALGDAVNTAARLETASKELVTPIVVSRATMEAAGLTSDASFVSLSVRGRSTEVEVVAFSRPELQKLLVRQKQAAS